MAVKLISLKLKSHEPWKDGGRAEAVEQIKETIKKDYKNSELTYIAGGSFAKVYGAIRVKGSEEKPVAVRIAVTDNEQTYKREKRPDKFFKELKNRVIAEETLEHLASGTANKKIRLLTKTKKKPYYYEFLNVPKLKYEINCITPTDSTPCGEAFGLVFESELAEGDAFSEAPLDEDTEAKLPGDRLKYIPRLIENIAKALAVLHNQGKIHSDLKPDNILVKNDGTEKISFQLTDFGMNWKVKKFTKIDGEKEKENVKTEENFKSWTNEKIEIFNKLIKRTGQNRFFSAPEKKQALAALLGLNEDIKTGEYKLRDINEFILSYNNLIDEINAIGPKSDIYSFGRTIQVIAMDRLNVQDVYSGYIDSICGNFVATSINRFEPRPGNKKDEELKKLIDKMTDEDPSKRPSAREILNDSYLR